MFGFFTTHPMFLEDKLLTSMVQIKHYNALVDNNSKKDIKYLKNEEDKI